MFVINLLSFMHCTKRL